MDDLLSFFGNAQKVIIEKAQIKKGTFSDKEDKKSIFLKAEFNEQGELISKKSLEKIETFVYLENEMICLHVTKQDGTPLYKIDYYYKEGQVVKTTKINGQGIMIEESMYYYNTDGKLEKKQSKTMTYEYTYNGDLLIEERWLSDKNINQIIQYSYEKDLLIETLHLSGEKVPGRRILLKRERLGFISEEIVYSASNMVVSHFKYEYITTFKKNWLKRIKYIIHSQNKIKEAPEVQYRDFKFYEQPEDIKVEINKVKKSERLEKPKILKTPVESPLEELGEEPLEEPGEEQFLNSGVHKLMFDNGTYKGDVVNGEMHGNGDFIFNTGTKYQGCFRKNVMEGKGKLTYINGKVYEGTFVNNVLEGPGACKWENGDFYVGEFKNGKMHGRGCYIWENGNRFEGIFEFNKRTEQGILYKRSELKSDAPPKWVNELFR